MASSMASGRNQDDLQSIQRQKHELKTNMVDSTRRMIGSIDESEVLARNTAEKLVEQHEQLLDIKKRLYGIDANLAAAKGDINKLRSIFGGVKNYFRPPKGVLRKSASQPQLNQATKKKTATPQQAAPSAVTKRPITSRADTDTYLGKRRSAMDDLELETEDGLYYVHQGLNRLKSSALNMNKELESQKPLDNDIGEALDALNKDVNKKIKVVNGILYQ